MKKVFITLAAAALLLGTPAAQAAFVPQPVAVTATAAPVSTMEVATVAGTEASAVAISKVVKTKKLSFFAKAKQLLRSLASGKSQLIALLLVLFVGGLGIHRFYLGYTWQGVVQLLTLGGLGIWALIDLIRIITGDLQPKDGSYESTL